jgi:hypothetical protein
VLAALLATVLCAAPENVDGGAACAHDRAALLALPPDKFDQDPKGGWRTLENKLKCAAVAADLLEEYRKAHFGSLTPQEPYAKAYKDCRPGRARAPRVSTTSATPPRRQREVRGHHRR